MRAAAGERARAEARGHSCEQQHEQQHEQSTSSSSGTSGESGKSAMSSRCTTSVERGECEHSECEREERGHAERERVQPELARMRYLQREARVVRGLSLIHI